MATTTNLARIDWQMGQTLLPEHFVAQEDALLSETRLRFKLLGLPYQGVGTLRWNDALLADGTVSIQGLTVVLPSGQLLDVPGNAAINTFNLNTVGATRVPLYLHLTTEKVSQEPQAGGGDWMGEGERLHRVVHRLELSPDQSYQAALFSMKLADCEKSSEGVWALSTNFIPPLLHVGGSPFLMAMVDSFQQLLEQFHYKLEQDVAASFLGGEGLFSAKLCLRSVYRLRRFLANLKGQVRFHPYHVYEELKSFYTDLCLYQDVTPEDVDGTYAHDQLARCIGRVARPLVEQIQVNRARTPYTTFEQKGGLFVIEEIPKQVRAAQELYFLVQKPRVGDRVSLEGLKLASASRLAVVHQLALQGVPMRKIDRPPFQHQFGSEVEFYLLSEGEEWDQALRDGSLAFYDRPDLAEIRAHLYWRNA
jgi:type VI secretion system protein ImpJ